jgi:hypothetical protein
MSATGDSAKRRNAEPFVYTPGHARGHTQVYLRRRQAKIRLAAHAALAAVALTLTGWWVIPHHSFSGPILVEVAPGRGVHVGDAMTVAFLVVAVLCGRSALRAFERLGR